MEERIQGAQQAAQHFPPDSLLCDAFKSAKNDGLDEIIIIASLNSQLNLRSKDACPGYGFLEKNSPRIIHFALELDFRSNQLTFQHSMTRTTIFCIQWYVNIPAQKLREQLLDRGSRNKIQWLNLVKLTWNTGDNFKMLWDTLKPTQKLTMKTKVNAHKKKKKWAQEPKHTSLERALNKRHGILILFRSSWNLSLIQNVPRTYRITHGETFEICLYSWIYE